MVERFNRRIAEAIAREPKRGGDRRLFASHDDRNDVLYHFVHDYNRTRLKCLDYQSPLQRLTNLPQDNTCAGMTARDSAQTHLALGDALDLARAKMLPIANSDCTRADDSLQSLRDIVRNLIGA